MSDTPPKNVAQAKDYSGYHEKTLLRALRRGELVGYQRGANCTWRIYQEDLDRWLRGEKPARQSA